MVKLLKILGRVSGSIIEWLLILVIAFAFAIRTSAVQTFLAQQAATYLSEELKAHVSIDQVAIYFFDRVALDGLLIEDQQGDTLIAVNRVLVNLDNINLKKKTYSIGEAELHDGYVHLQRDKDSVFNHAFLKDYFVKDTKKKSPVTLGLRFANFSNIHFRYDDNLKEQKEVGMDYFHLDAKNVSGHLLDLTIKNDTIRARIEGLSALEKSGFDLRCLTTSAKISPLGVYLSDLEINTKESWVRSEQFNMISKTYTSFKYFVDSVKFDGQIDASNVSLKEIAYFASALDGMDGQVRVKSKIKNKVTKLRLPDFELEYKKNTFVHADLRLADYRNMENGFYDERLEKFYIDFEELKQLRLPNSAAKPYLKLSPEIERLEFVEGDAVAITGFAKDFVFAANTFQTALGWARLNEGINFKQSESGDHYRFQSSATQQYDFTVHNFLLGSYLDNSDVGQINGSFKIAGDIYSASDIRFSNITGDINTFEFMNYSYQNIVIHEGAFQKNRFDGYVTVDDEFLKLSYSGFLDFNNDHQMKFDIFITGSNLKELHFTEETAELISNLSVDIKGKNVNTYSGTIAFDSLSYAVDNHTFTMDDFLLSLTRGLVEDRFEITGTALDAEIVGKVNLMKIVDNFNYQFSRIFPSLYGEQAKNFSQPTSDKFTYTAKFKTPNHFLHLFYNDLFIAKNTRVSGNYAGTESRFSLNLYSDSLRYKTMTFNNLSLEQTLDSEQIMADYHIDQFKYTDSLVFNDVYLNTNGGNNNLAHRLTWKDQRAETSEISWDTEVKDMDHFGFMLNPSHFHLRNHEWDITRASSITFSADTIQVDNFELTRNQQKIMIHGQVSSNENETIDFDVENLELAELSSFLTTEYPMTGIINLSGSIADPFGSLGYEGEGTLKQFYVKNQKVGDLSIGSEWNKEKQAIETKGNLFYADERTFDFDGFYYLFEEENNIDFNLNFDRTNLQFTNAFMDPDVVSEIRGFLDGSLTLKGTPSLPLLEGSVDLQGGSAYVDILGVHFGLNGPIEVDEYGFYINGIPIFDEDANAGLLVGSVFHDNFTNFNFDLQFDLESQLFASNEPIFGPEYFQRFLVMNLPYSHDALYYGKGYVTGTANIFGYTDNLEITVNFKTEKGTELNIPMFGVGEIDEEDFIQFVDDKSDTLEEIEAPLYDLTGVYLDLNFEATRDANVQIIFNEEIGDVIKANGTGDISIRLNNQNDISMEGTYEVSKGVYNFAMLPVNNSPFTVKQPFIIEPGGTVSWTGDPYDARINLKTYYELNANLSEISGGTNIGATGGAHQRILSYLLLTGSIEAPAIQFDIQAPQANDVGKTLINRIKSDPDELNRQFFSLMISRQFQPLAGSTSSNGSGALELVTNQINQVLSRVSKDYRLKLDIDNDIVSGDNTFEFGVSKGFLDDRLILSGSFGVESYGEEEVDDNGQIHTGQLIGDLHLEYLLNDAGTFRVNIFNESADNTIIQERGDGSFTQGTGLSYQEDFESFNDFKVVQFVFDLFRKEENKRVLNESRGNRRPVPNSNFDAPKSDIIDPEKK